jgi:hypothetical protein
MPTYHRPKQAAVDPQLLQNAHAPAKPIEQQNRQHILGLDHRPLACHDAGPQPLSESLHLPTLPRWVRGDRLESPGEPVAIYPLPRSPYAFKRDAPHFQQPTGARDLQQSDQQVSGVHWRIGPQREPLVPGCLEHRCCLVREHCSPDPAIRSGDRGRQAWIRRIARDWPHVEMIAGRQSRLLQSMREGCATDARDVPLHGRAARHGLGVTSPTRVDRRQSQSGVWCKIVKRRKRAIAPASSCGIPVCPSPIVQPQPVDAWPGSA